MIKQKRIIFIPIIIGFAIVLIITGLLGVVVVKKGFTPLISSRQEITPSIIPSKAPVNINISPTPRLVNIPKSTITKTPEPTIIKSNPPILNGNNIFYFINDYRLKNGIPQLSQSEQICQLAQERANFLVKEDPSGQKSSAGRHYMFEEFIQSKNITFSIGENQYGTTSSGDIQVIEGWKKSPSHNALMLATEFKGDLYTRGCVRVATNGQDNVVIFLIGGN